MSAYSSGVASSRGVMGAADSSTPVTDKWQGDMRAAADRIRTKYSGPGPYLAGAVLLDVDKAWKVASQFADQAPSVSSMRPDQITRAKNNALDLLELRAGLKLRDPMSALSRAELDNVVAKMSAPIAWLVAVGAPVLAANEPGDFPWRTLMWGGLVIGGLYALSKAISSASEFKREVVGPRTLTSAPRELVKNPPAWAADPELWEHARIAVENSGEQYDNAESVKVHVYKQLGGRVS